MKISELRSKQETMKMCDDFVSWAAKKLKISDIPEIQLSNDKDMVDSKRSFGTTHPTGEIWVYVGNRNTADILRTLCHELVHLKQFQLGLSTDHLESEEKRLRIEDVANAMAGRMMREYGKLHVEIY